MQHEGMVSNNCEMAAKGKDVAGILKTSGLVSQKKSAEESNNAYSTFIN